MTAHPLNEMATVIRLLGNMSCGRHSFPDKRQHLQDPGVSFLFFCLSERHSSNHPSIWLLLVSDQRFLVLLSSVSLLLSASRSFKKHAPPSSHFTSINVILWELTGVLVGKRSWIQMICLRGNDNARSLTKQSCECSYPGGVLHLVSNFSPHLFAARETDLLA